MFGGANDAFFIFSEWKVPNRQCYESTKSSELKENFESVQIENVNTSIQCSPEKLILLLIILKDNSSNLLGKIGNNCHRYEMKLFLRICEQCPYTFREFIWQL